MRRFLVSILILAAFLGGYYVGHQEGSPDIFAWAARNYPRVAEAGERYLGQLDRPREDAAASGRPHARRQAADFQAYYTAAPTDPPPPRRR